MMHITWVDRERGDTMGVPNKYTELIESEALNFRPICQGHEANEGSKQLVELQLKMATCSINHEYARMEFDDISDGHKREELLDYMNECRQKYDEARTQLSSFNPFALAEFEADLMRQKQMMMGGYSA